MSPATSTNNVGQHGNSASSTVEEGIMTITEGSKPVSLRKKKLRLRRKHIVSKKSKNVFMQFYFMFCIIIFSWFF